jgi:hypothetical protein
LFLTVAFAVGFFFGLSRSNSTEKEEKDVQGVIKEAPDGLDSVVQHLQERLNDVLAAFPYASRVSGAKTKLRRNLLATKHMFEDPYFGSVSILLQIPSL